MMIVIILMRTWLAFTFAVHGIAEGTCNEKKVKKTNVVNVIIVKVKVKKRNVVSVTVVKVKMKKGEV